MGVLPWKEKHENTIWKINRDMKQNISLLSFESDNKLKSTSKKRRKGNTAPKQLSRAWETTWIFKAESFYVVHC